MRDNPHNKSGEISSLPFHPTPTSPLFVRGASRITLTNTLKTGGSGGRPYWFEGRTTKMLLFEIPEIGEGDYLT